SKSIPALRLNQLRQPVIAQLVSIGLQQAFTVNNHVGSREMEDQLLVGSLPVEQAAVPEAVGAFGRADDESALRRGIAGDGGVLMELAGDGISGQLKPPVPVLPPVLLSARRRGQGRASAPHCVLPAAGLGCSMRRCAPRHAGHIATRQRAYEVRWRK